VLLVISGFHDFVLGTRVAELMQQVERGEQPPLSTVTARKRLVMLARFNMPIAIAAAVVGMMLVRGVPG
jgi:hypothetical protein